MTKTRDYQNSGIRSPLGIMGGWLCLRSRVCKQNVVFQMDMLHQVFT